jgi:hypothetical protein
MRFLILIGAMALASCGDGFAERSVSGAGIGAASTLVLGPGAVVGAVVGGAVGGLTDSDQIDLGEPVWD